MILTQEDAPDGACGEVERHERDERNTFNIEESWCENAHPRAIVINCRHSEKECPVDGEERIYPVDPPNRWIRDARGDDQHDRRHYCAGCREWQISTSRLRDNDENSTDNKECPHSITVIMWHAVVRRDTLPADTHAISTAILSCHTH